MVEVLLYLLNINIFKNRDDLSINSEAIESLSIEITHNESKNIIFNVVYRLLDVDIDVCENYFKNIFFEDNVIRKNILLRWCRVQDLFGSQILVTTGVFELQISCIRSS